MKIRIVGALLTLIAGSSLGAGAAAQAPPGSWDASLPGAASAWTFTDLFDDGTGYASLGTNVVYKTQDGGTTWTPQPGPEPWSEVLRLSFSDAEVGFATNGSIVYRTEDAASSWTALPALPVLPGTDFPPRIDGLEAIPGSNDVIVTTWGFLNSDGCTQARADHTIVRSHGDKWRQLPLDFPASTYEIEFLNDEVGVVLVHRFHREEGGTDCVYAIRTGSSNVFLTRDGGRSFTRIHHADFVDGDPVFAVAVPASERVVLGTRGGAILVSDNGGKTFRETARLTPPGPAPDAMLDAISFGTPRIGYAGTNGTGLWRTRNGGVDWVLEPSPYEAAHAPEDAFRGSISAAGRNAAIASGPGSLARRTTD